MSSLHPLRKLLFTALLAGLVLAGIPPAPARAAGEFTDIAAGLPGFSDSAAAWGDYDSDGDLDILLTGNTGDDLIARLYRNNGGTFQEIHAGLPGVQCGSVAWGDYDSDGDLDILLAGSTGSGRITQVFRNNTTTANTPPAAPTGLAASVAADGKIVSLSWQAASDDHTPSSGLTYNLRLGTTPGGSDLLSPMAAGNGWRRLPALGSAQGWLTATLSGLDLAPDTTVYWSVQAIDSAFQGGPFAAEGTFGASAPPPTPPAPRCRRADVAAVIYGAPEGTAVKAYVGGTEQPTLYTAHDAFGRQAVLWTFYPPASTNWTVTVEPQLPPGYASPRWQYRLVRIDPAPPGFQPGQAAGGAVTVRRCSGTVLHFNLVDSGAQ